MSYIDNGYNQFLQIDSLSNPLSDTFGDEQITDANVDSFIAEGAIGGDSLSSTAVTNTAGPSILGWSQNMAWSATDSDTVAWSSGTISLADGTTYSITGSNTGNMSAITYMYLDTDTSTTALQTSTTASDAVGTNKILVAVAEDSTSPKDAIFQAFGGQGVGTLITADNIAANTITANEILANTITSSEITGEILSGIFADLGTIEAGTITLNSSGHIKSGQTAYDTGTGFWLGYSSGAKFSIGDASTNKLTWDGSTLTIRGVLTADDIAASGTITGNTLQTNSDPNRGVKITETGGNESSGNIQVYGDIDAIELFDYDSSSNESTIYQNSIDNSLVISGANRLLLYSNKDYYDAGQEIVQCRGDFTGTVAGYKLGNSTYPWSEVFVYNSGDVDATSEGGFRYSDNDGSQGYYVGMAEAQTVYFDTTNY